MGLITLIESSIINTKVLEQNEYHKYNKLSPFYIFYSYYSKIKFSIFTISKFINTTESISKIFLNSSWLEREFSEMYGIKLIGSQDTRKLLLDYGKLEFPMLREFPSEGFNDVFYSILEDQVIYYNSGGVEL